MSSNFKPVVAIVGRPNVGKSTLFNRLTRSRDAIVADYSGLTRDRHYGEGRVGDSPYLVVDTGGFEPETKSGILVEMAKQTEQAIVESDVVIFLVDARAGINSHDHDIAVKIRRIGRPVLLAVNKAEGMQPGQAAAEFYELGLGEPYQVSSAHGDGVRGLIDLALEKAHESYEAHAELIEAFDDEDELSAPFAEQDELSEEAILALEAEADALESTDFNESEAQAEDDADLIEHRIKLAIVGRPNVGKSTLINALLGEERVIAFDLPGTTRDAIEIEFDHGERKYTLIDTAGLRKRGRVFETIEKFSVIKTLQAIEASNVAVLVLDAQSEISEQDAHIAGFVLESGRSLVVAINKWDGLDDYNKEWIEREFNRKLRFLNFAKMHKISALKGRGIGALLKSVNQAHDAAFRKLSTPRLTRVLREAVDQQAPPRKGMFRPKLRYAHQGGQNPPLVIIHGNQLEAVPDSYRRYLETRFRQAFKLDGTPLRIQFKSTRNPYV
ncbi:GTP-binding protein EngA [Oligella ureolytica]|uniref:ribosome biogenesis GTPase Der n=1 Tax=Oligella ureolytica TaxID=90244 RepID=UPI000E0864F4|nr:ribosome biogenesis GTPase Der [Oligella ureolytica]SUA51692.1 GTP-binding protein EngA [Oligella ureolytica]